MRQCLSLILRKTTVRRGSLTPCSLTEGLPRRLNRSSTRNSSYRDPLRVRERRVKFQTPLPIRAASCPNHRHRIASRVRKARPRFENDGPASTGYSTRPAHMGCVRRLVDARSPEHAPEAPLRLLWPGTCSPQTKTKVDDSRPSSAGVAGENARRPFIARRKQSSRLSFANLSVPFDSRYRIVPPRKLSFC
jgi:hypothetical protein